MMAVRLGRSLTVAALIVPVPLVRSLIPHKS